MGDHFVLLVDRLLTESTLEAAIGSINQGSTLDEEVEFSTKKKIVGDGTFTGILVECRICQDEDEDVNMETPCSCSGSLKFAHRKCVQKWCNEKGDTTCEICLQQFNPGYTAPPKLFLYGTTPMQFRGNWEVSRHDIQNHQIVTMTQTDRHFLRPNYDDYAASNDRNIMYCRAVATMFMIVMVIRHSLYFVSTEAKEQYSIPLFILILLRIAGIVLPLYVILRAVTTFYQRRQLLVNSSFSTSSKPLTLNPSSTDVFGVSRKCMILLLQRQKWRTGNLNLCKFCSLSHISSASVSSVPSDVKSTPLAFKLTRKKKQKKRELEEVFELPNMAQAFH